MNIYARRTLKAHYTKLRKRLLVAHRHPKTVAEVIRSMIADGSANPGFALIMDEQEASYSSPRAMYMRFKSSTDLKYAVRDRAGRKCEHCGQGRRFTVRHVLPIITHPHLALAISNLKLICGECVPLKAWRE